MDVSLEQLGRLAAESEEGRHEVIAALQKLALSLESPQDTIHRYGHMNLQAAMVQVGINLKIFKHLTESDVPVTVDQISAKTGAEPQLMTRVVRFLSAIGAVDESGKNQFAANHVTRNLTESVVEAGLSHYFSTAARQYQSLPDYLQETGYKNPSDDTKTAFGLAFGISQSPYAWFANNPAELAYFNAYMALRRESGRTWLSVYPVVSEAVDWPSDKGLYVNIGGGIGHQCAQFKEKYPTLQGRVVLQDFPHSVAQALPTPGVENMAHNMFEPQPILGAKFYYLRAVLHNQPENKLRLLLETIKVAMGLESVLLIDEMVLPEVGASYVAASLDMTMLSAFAGMERTEKQWRETFEQVGLELVHTYTYYSQSYESVMDVRLPRTQPSRG
ncbi:putative O-methyl transferase B [Rosellinia necatrix]|uniref:Putative O-methyl transferase B n=1 Tax=Rosellinia necatrix TaxID=77044 RepID=A0A1W2TSH8_ROSNE|nr:putative O-methyl transferase B [Rosellinia necatrix]